ncbi:MAG: SCPU domain-containing protein [Comamonadaceae bacterium]|nr:MAG: SCPU domain-containing protein [Comamonadaceae bacterium]
MRALRRMEEAWRLPLLACALVLPQVASAQSWSNCNINTAPPIVFGVYNPLLYGDLVAQSSIAITCVGLGAARINMLAGLGGGGITARAMQRGAARLPYQLYRDSARTQVWGDGTAGTSVATLGVFIFANQTFPVYARILQRQDVPVGLYTDTVQVRVDF